MGIAIFEGQASSAIAARLEALRGDLVEADAAVATAEAALEEAVAAGTSSDRQLKVLGDARAKSAALVSVINKAVLARGRAEAREERARKRLALAAIAQRFGNILADLEKKKGKLISVAEEARKAEADYDKTANELSGIMAEVEPGSSAASLIPRGAAYSGTIGKSADDADSELRSVTSAAGGAIERAQKHAEKERVDYGDK
jgi:hypothetical protein